MSHGTFFQSIEHEVKKVVSGKNGRGKIWKRLKETRSFFPLALLFLLHATRTTKTEALIVFQCQCCFTLVPKVFLDFSPRKRVARWEPRSGERDEPEGVICRLQIAGCRLQVAGCRLQVAGYISIMSVCAGYECISPKVLHKLPLNILLSIFVFPF